MKGPRATGVFPDTARPTGSKGSRFMSGPIGRPTMPSRRPTADGGTRSVAPLFNVSTVDDRIAAVRRQRTADCQLVRDVERDGDTDSPSSVFMACWHTASLGARARSESGWRSARLVRRSPPAFCSKPPRWWVLVSLLGGGAAVWLGRFVENQLYGVKPADALTVVVAATSLALVAAIAALLPARRASVISPMMALRDQ